MALPIQKHYSLAINCSIVIIYSDSVPHSKHTHKTASQDEQRSRRLTLDMTITLFNPGPRVQSFFEKLYVKSSLARPVTEPIFQSWVKWLGPRLSTSQTLREFKI